MAEMARAGEDHGDACLVGRRDNLGVANRTAGLDDGRDSGGRGEADRLGGCQMGVGGQDGLARALPSLVDRQPKYVQPIGNPPAMPTVAVGLATPPRRKARSARSPRRNAGCRSPPPWPSSASRAQAA